MYNNEWDDVLTLTDDIVNSGKFELYNDFYELFKIRENYVMSLC